MFANFLRIVSGEFFFTEVFCSKGAALIKEDYSLVIGVL